MSDFTDPQLHVVTPEEAQGFIDAESTEVNPSPLAEDGGPAEEDSTDSQEPWTREKQQEVNRTKLGILLQMGIDINSIILSTRLELLVQTLMPDGEEGGVEHELRVQFDDEFERRLEVSLNEAARQTRERILSQQSGLVVPT